jgi:hypothetical protein
MNDRMWICSKCGRVYPQQLRFCSKCNISRKHATRLVDKFINNENKVTTIKGKNNLRTKQRKYHQEKNKK